MMHNATFSNHWPMLSQSPNSGLPLQPISSSVIVLCDVLQYWLSLWLVWVSSPGCLPFQLLEHLQFLSGWAEWEDETTQQLLVHACVTNIVFLPSPKHRTIPDARRINSTPGRTRTHEKRSWARTLICVQLFSDVLSGQTVVCVCWHNMHHCVYKGWRSCSFCCCALVA